MTTTLEIQRRLAGLGISPGPLDGRDGPKTRAAVRAFQRINGLRPDGIAGPMTLAELFPVPIAGRDDFPSPLDPPEPSRGAWPPQSRAGAFFGTVGKNQAMLTCPYPMRLAWDLRRSIRRFSIHEKCHDSAQRVLERVANHYGPDGIRKHGFDLFGGCLNVRKMRGGSRYSMHSWGIAIDFDPARNRLRWGRDRAYLARPECRRFWELWEQEGWISLGRARNFDWMHVQAATL